MPKVLKAIDIAEVLEKRPKVTYGELSRHFGVSRQALHSFIKRHPSLRKKRPIEVILLEERKIVIDALNEIADLGDELSSTIAIRTLKKIR